MRGAAETHDAAPLATLMRDYRRLFPDFSITMFQLWFWLFFRDDAAADVSSRSWMQPGARTAITLLLA